MEPVALGFTAVLLMGLVFGAGPCNVACLPYLGPVFLGPGRGWAHVAAFSSGRLTGYVAVAAAAGALGQVATHALEGRAVLLLLRRKKPCAGAKGGIPTEATVTLSPVRRPRLLPVTLFGMGIGMALNPCVPLSTVLLAAAASASPWTGAWLGLGFGVGATVVPSLVFGWLVSHFGREVRAHVGHWLPRLEQGAGVLMISLGVFTMAGWVHP